MKKRLVILFATALCLLAAMPGKSAWAADPGSRYADAFVLIEQGQAAEEKSDLPTAYHNYQSALSTLHSIRTDSPDWNAQMVEYRLKDCQSRFDAIKAKLPEPPPAPAAAATVGSTVTPVVEAPTPPPAPVVAPPPPPQPPPAPVVKAEVPDQSPKLTARIDKLEAENKDLRGRLAAAEKKAAAVRPPPPPPPAPVPVDSGEVQKLRAELNKTRAEADTARKSAALVPDLQKQNRDLNSQLAAAEKKAAAVKPTAPVPVPTDSAELKNLRAEVDKARADADNAHKAAADLERQNKDLNAKLASAEKKTNIAPADSAEVKNLHSQLDKSNAEVADLKKQLAAKPTVAAAPVPVDNSEVKNLRAQLADTQKQLDQAKKSASQVPELQKQNQDLNAKLAAADKKASARAAELEKENKDLSAKLADEKKEDAEAPAAAPDVRVMKQLRNENSYLRNLLDTYAEQNSELKGQLHRHDQNQGKTSQ